MRRTCSCTWSSYHIHPRLEFRVCVDSAWFVLPAGARQPGPPPYLVQFRGSRGYIVVRQYSLPVVLLVEGVISLREGGIFHQLVFYVYGRLSIGMVLSIARRRSVRRGRSTWNVEEKWPKRNGGGNYREYVFSRHTRGVSGCWDTPVGASCLEGG